MTKATAPRRVAWHDVNVEATRVDRWLWAVRIYKTRAAATEACRGGHVRVNGTTAKAGSPVRIGDRVEAQAHTRHRVIEVACVIDRRVGADVARQCLVDHGAPPPPKEAPIAPRAAGAGRPTKRERRQLERFRLP